MSIRSGVGRNFSDVADVRLDSIIRFKAEVGTVRNYVSRPSGGLRPGISTTRLIGIWK